MHNEWGLCFGEPSDSEPHPPSEFHIARACGSYNILANHNMHAQEETEPIKLANGKPGGLLDQYLHVNTSLPPQRESR